MPHAPDLTTERVYVETSEYSIIGTMTLRSVQRVSDALNDKDRRFLPLSEVVAVSKVDGTESATTFLAVSLSHITVAFSLANSDALDSSNHPFGLAARMRGLAAGSS